MKQIDNPTRQSHQSIHTIRCPTRIQHYMQRIRRFDLK